VGQAFREFEGDKDEVDYGERPCGIEGSLRGKFTHLPTEKGAEDEAEPDGCPEETHGAGARFPGGDICDVGLGDTDVGAGDPVDDTGDEEHPERLCGTHEKEAGGGAGHADEEYGAPPVAV